MVGIHVDVLDIFLPFKLFHNSSWLVSSCAFWALASVAFPGVVYRFNAAYSHPSTGISVFSELHPTLDLACDVAMSWVVTSLLHVFSFVCIFPITLEHSIHGF